MKFYQFIIYSIIFSSLVMTQFTEVSVNIDYSNVNENKTFIFENFQQELTSYFVNNHFFDESENLDMVLNAHMIIENINEKGGEKIVSAQILFSNQLDVHLFTKSFDFIYNKSEALYKSEIFHSLASLLNCYAYLQIAYELDTYKYLGGNKYFLKAENIASDGKNSMYSKNWQTRLKKIRREKGNHTYRALRYNFFVVADQLLFSEDPNYDEANNFYKNFYNSIIEYEEYYGYSKPLTQFLNTYNEEIVTMAKHLQFDEIINYLLIYDEANQHIYQKYYEE